MLPTTLNSSCPTSHMAASSSSSSSCTSPSKTLPLSCILSNTKPTQIMDKNNSLPKFSCSYSEFGFTERSNSYNFNGPLQKGTGFCAANDPELKRKKRIKSYNVFTVEGKLKTSVRNGFKWIKNKLGDIRTGV